MTTIKRMSALTNPARAALPGSSFAEPKARKYPIPNVSHARNALARVAGNGTPAEKAMVRSEVGRRFPTIVQAKKVKK